MHITSQNLHITHTVDRVFFFVVSVVVHCIIVPISLSVMVVSVCLCVCFVFGVFVQCEAVMIECMIKHKLNVFGKV